MKKITYQKDPDKPPVTEFGDIKVDNIFKKIKYYQERVDKLTAELDTYPYLPESLHDIERIMPMLRSLERLAKEIRKDTRPHIWQARNYRNKLEYDVGVPLKQLYKYEEVIKKTCQKFVCKKEAEERRRISIPFDKERDTIIGIHKRCLLIKEQIFTRLFGGIFYIWPTNERKNITTIPKTADVVIKLIDTIKLHLPDEKETGKFYPVIKEISDYFTAVARNLAISYKKMGVADHKDIQNLRDGSVFIDMLANEILTKELRKVENKRLKAIKKACCDIVEQKFRYAIQDISLIPDEFIRKYVNYEAIKEYCKKHRKELTDGSQPIAGVFFFPKMVFKSKAVEGEDIFDDDEEDEDEEEDTDNEA